MNTNTANQTPHQQHTHILTSQTSEAIKAKIQKASALLMERNYQAYKDLENK